MAAAASLITRPVVSEARAGLESSSSRNSTKAAKERHFLFQGVHTMCFANEECKSVFNKLAGGLSLSIVGGTLMELLPAIAALTSIIWGLIHIYETRPGPVRTGLENAKGGKTLDANLLAKDLTIGIEPLSKAIRIASPAVRPEVEVSVIVVAPCAAPAESVVVTYDSVALSPDGPSRYDDWSFCMKTYARRHVHILIPGA
jgi:hypothetical protein